MKKYKAPEVEIIEVMGEDIITSSPGTETPTITEQDSIWDLDIG